MKMENTFLTMLVAALAFVMLCLIWLLEKPCFVENREKRSVWSPLVHQISCVEWKYPDLLKFAKDHRGDGVWNMCLRLRRETVDHSGKVLEAYEYRLDEEKTD